MKAANDNAVEPPPRARTFGRPCPICGQASKPERAPFCSKRCADIDLHRWLGGSYVFPSRDSDDAEAARPADDETP